MEAESTVTRTREVMGTPSYMAPERAAGEHTRISSATDVYGLGACSTNCSLGIRRLLVAQPTRLSSYCLRLNRGTAPLNAKIDRELSTICLKCLEKDPQRRYSSALGLAEDLEHWLKHEPIQAKPSGFFTHAHKWVRRNPTSAQF